MKKLFYDENGWICNRYPYDIQITDENRFVQVDEATENETFFTSSHFSWRIKNGQLVNERYEETPEEETLENLRLQRESECFSVINRGNVWYDKLTVQQKTEISTWYDNWLDITQTKEKPTKPEWLV